MDHATTTYNKLVKLFLVLIFMVFFYVLLTVLIIESKRKMYTVIRDINVTFKSTPKTKQYHKDNKNNSMGMKYILQWTSPKVFPFSSMGIGQQVFIERKCPYTNCFVTGDRQLLGGDVTKFDVIAFATSVFLMKQNLLPQERSPHQKYAFASIESSEHYPVCSNKFDDFFNWTWTFRLDSDVKWGYMVIRDKELKVVGPKKDMNWMKFKDMEQISDELKEQLQSKTVAAAWFVSNCYTRSERELFVRALQFQLELYNLTVDIYGQCGNLVCPRFAEAACFNLIKKTYYFYLSFENSFDEDYVTEKLLNAVQHDAVPIVFGAANYSRFLPENSYLNARDLGVEKLAAKMNEIIKNRDDYYKYFRWKKYYTYHRTIDSVDTDEYCLFCTTLNDEKLVEERKVYKNFKKWWDPPNHC